MGYFHTKQHMKVITMLFVGVDVTAVSGSFSAGEGLSCWLQSSDDGGTTWYDIAVDWRLLTATGPADNAATATTRNISDDCQAVEQWCALFRHLPTDRIRLKFDISGTTPDFTFSVSAIGK